MGYGVALAKRIGKKTLKESKQIDMKLKQGDEFWLKAGSKNSFPPHSYYSQIHFSHLPIQPLF